MDLYVKSANTTSSSSNEKPNPASISISSSSSSKCCSRSGATATTTTTAAAAATTRTTTTSSPSTDHHHYWSDNICNPLDRYLSWAPRASTIFTKLNAGKRKRRASTNDPELGYEPPSAKRLQRLAAVVCGSEQGQQMTVVDASLGSTVYTSPLGATTNGEQLVIAAPPSPLPDSPDSPPSPDRGVKLPATVVPYDDEADAELAGAEGEYGCVKYSCDEEEEDDVADDEQEWVDEDDELEEDDDEEINSSSSSPASSTATGCSQNGERTPATQQQQHQQQHQQQQQQHQQQHLPLSHSVSKDALNKQHAFDDFSAHNSYNCISPAVETTVRQCPLPALSWGNAADVWQLMCQRDEQDSHLRSSGMLEQHPGLQPRMRAILLDWLIEVCEVYKLHRETFYLAVDYLDRYLCAAKQVQKTHLQLIGITCLFVAAKVEEIYPPKISEFAYVTDGACTEHDILQYEKLLLQSLGWDICPITIIGWVGVYMQLNVNNTTPAALTHTASKQAMSVAQPDDAFIYPQFSAYEFMQTSQVLDLCTLDVGMANYPYSVLAAAAISHTFDRETALRCSGLDWHAIQPCARWMEPFFHVIAKRAPHLHLNEQNEQVTNKFGLAHICPNISTDDSHIIQTHTTTMDMYDELLMAQNALHAMRARTQASPATALRAPESLLTPPASSHKPDEYLGDEEDVPTASASASAAAAVNASSHSTAGRGSSLSSSNRT